MKKRVSFAFVSFTLAVSLLVSGCMETAQTDKPVVAGQSTSGSALAGGEMAMADGAQTNTRLAAERPASAGGYRIAAQDILQIDVFQVKDLNNTVQVNEDGSVALPLIGKIQLRGKTTDEAEQILAAKLREKYLQSPQVSVSIKQYGKRITVSGEVKQPNVLADDGNTTLSQAVARSGGLSELGDSSRIHVARSKDERVQDDIYNLDAIQSGKATDPLLKGGDIVVAETSGTRVALKSVKDLLPFAVFASIF